MPEAFLLPERGLAGADFGPNADQRALQEALAEFLQDRCTLEAVRRVLDGDGGAQDALARGLTQLGVHALTVPARHEGLGLGLLDAALAAELAGRWISPVDWLATNLAALALDWAGSAPQQDHWLPRLAAGGTVRLGVALGHAASTREGQSVASKGERLHGRSLFALCPPGASALLLPDAQGALWIVACDAPGVALRPLITIDRTRSLHILELQAAAAQRLEGAHGPPLVDRLLAAARLLLAADALGAAQRMLDTAVAYAHERRQFGVAIGSFQAVKHLCAEMAAELEPCRALLWHAADVLQAQAPDALVTACLAKARIADVSQFVARGATEVHGGIGFTEALGLHLWFKRIGLDRQLWGGPRALRAQAARLQGWGT